MRDDPLDAVYSYVERAYIRLQAGDVLIRCLEEENTLPIQQMVEGLVLAGPKSITSLQEILSETERRKSQVMDDLNQVFSQLEGGLKSYGVKMTGVRESLTMTRLSSVRFLAMLREQNITEESEQIACLQLLRDSKELMVSLAGHIRLLEEIENYLKDWLWGLAFQSARQGKEDRRDSSESLSL